MSSVVAFTFGSFGDIISLVQIANSVRKALYDIQDTSSEYRDLVAELDSLVFTIASVQRELDTNGLNRPSPAIMNRPSPAIMNGLYFALNICLRLLAQANERISAYRKAVADSNARWTLSSMRHRLGWTFVRKDEVVTLRVRLSEQIKAIDTLLTLAQNERLNRDARQAKRAADRVDRATDQLDVVMREQHTQHTLIVEILRCVQNLPQSLGRSRDGDPNAPSLSINFRFLGGNNLISVPWELCATKELFHDFLIFYTRNRREAELIRCNVYDLISDIGAGPATEFEQDKGWESERFKGRPGMTEWESKVKVRPGITIEVVCMAVLRRMRGSFGLRV